MSDPRYYKYFAFISYSRKDEAFAKRLQHFLTGFKLPTSLCRQYPDKPQTLRPIYRDKTDLGVDKLNQGLTHGLSLSKYLIVICSENSARPNRDGKNWIDEEVRTFLSLEEGNTDRVIPVLLRQKGQRTVDCTPPAVKELGLLAADVWDKGENRVFSDVAAKMLGLEPDELWNWWERDQRNRRRGMALLGMLAASLITSVGWLAWDYFIPNYSYFTDYVECNNIPRGVNAIPKGMTKRLSSYYRITTQFHRITCIENLNAEGKRIATPELPGHRERPVAISVGYDNAGQYATEHIYSNAAGKAVQKRLVNDGTIMFVPADMCRDRASDSEFGRAAFSLSGRSGAYQGESPVNDLIVQYLQIKRENGYITEEHYSTDAKGKVYVSNAEGIWGRRFTRDAYGRVVEVNYLDKQDRTMPNRHGVATIRYEYDNKEGQVKRISYYDREGNRTPGPNKSAIENYRWKQGYLVEVSYWNTETERCYNADRISSYISRYDETGCEVLRLFYGTDGKPCMNTDGCAGFKYEYDVEGHLIAATRLDATKHPETTEDGYAVTELQNDENGNILTVTYYDENNRYSRSRDGYAIRQQSYDKNGNISTVAFYSAPGQPCTNTNGVAKIEISYQDKENRYTESYSDVNGNPCKSKMGFARMEQCYDDQKRTLTVKYFDEKNNPCMRKEGYAIQVESFDALGRRVAMEFRDTNGQLCMREGHYASWRAEYDTLGNEISCTIYDTENKICLHDLAFAGYRQTYDERGNITAKTFFGTDKQACLTRNGYASIQVSYDERGNQTSLSYYDTQGKRCGSDEGYSYVMQEYDERDMVTSCKYYDENNQPCLSAQGFHSAEYRYNEQGNSLEEATFGTDGKPCMNTYGFALRMVTYAPKTGRCTAVHYYDSDGNLCDSEQGCAYVLYIYDEKSRLISAEYYNAENQLIRKQ